MKTLFIVWVAKIKILVVMNMNALKILKVQRIMQKNPQWFWATMVIEKNGITRLLKEYKLGVLFERKQNDLL